MISQGFWNTVRGAVKNAMNWWLLEGRKRERCLKGVGTQSMELDAKGNGLTRVLEHSQGAVKKTMNWWLLEGTVS
ncbi:hypothetical protein GHT06_020331 [Daphnia sinensis]|uniref:Uncharacterized protein n=1 Tax=Daphnia sinensis TaxID=1820382 RepID=A0AAD5KL98_9CRUS|nr:hypothetical protein GHT06_020331 [Daphnia sinensis]